MSMLLSWIVTVLVAAAPAALVVVVVRRAPALMALVAAALVWTFGKALANPNDPLGIDPVTGSLVFFDWRPRWRELLGAACKLAGLAGAAVAGVRVVRRWREPARPPAQAGPEWTCGACGTTVRDARRRCPACGGEIWHPEDEAE